MSDYITTGAIILGLGLVFGAVNRVREIWGKRQ